MHASSNAANEAASPVSIIVTGMDSRGQLYREQVTATVVEGDQYCFTMSRHVRLQASVLIEFPAAKGTEKPRRLSCRVVFAGNDPDPENPREVHLRPEESLKRSAGPAPVAVVPPAPAASAPQPTVTAAPAPPLQVAPQAAPPATRPAPANLVAAEPAPAAPNAAPLLDAVRGQAADGILKEVQAKLAAESMTLSRQVGQQIAKELSEHATRLSHALETEVAKQTSHVQARIDELRALLGTIQMEMEGKRTLAEEDQRGRLEAFDKKTRAMLREAENRFGDFRAALAEQQRTIQAHVQQTVCDSLSTATKQIEGKLDSITQAAAGKSQAVMAEQARQLEDRLQTLYGRLSYEMRNAEAALTALQAAAGEAEQCRAGLESSVAAVPKLPPVDAAMRQHIQDSIALARSGFRESLERISQQLESGLSSRN